MLDVDYIISGDYVLTMVDGMPPLRGAAIAVRNGKIVDIGDSKTIAYTYNPRKNIGGSGKAVLPGLINTHTHAAMVYFRGIADDLPLREWLEVHIWPAEGKWLSDEFVGDATELACCEMLKAGITTYNDMYFFGDSTASVTKKMGMRAVLGAGVLDFPTAAASNATEYIEHAERFIKDWLGDDLITPSIAPHAPYTCSPQTYMKAKQVAQRYGVPLHTHLSETQFEVDEAKKKYGKSPVELLDDIGFLDETVIAAHCVWVSGKEIEILAKRNTGVAHCIESNLKLASGIAPVVAMLKQGVAVALGTDGAASNNDLDVFSEMAIAARIHKAVSGDPTALNAITALTMATSTGAKVLGMGDKTGTLEAGKSADIIIVDLNKPHLTPFYDIYSLIVYSMKSLDVESVMVNGKLLVDGGKCLFMDEQEIMDKAVWWKNKVDSKR
ncbi:amidohydrolase [Candidatus Magnetominusculus xianensis]|uniref:5-methylthioadenosine/S-adenosylhomocysteine deaminase n=1 Tax=Candidatus Magnetominusculus xianensis TaxID=1748249 RepID=A0ABR5SIW8_9BACT|nr:amidohydrolase [Candidatus Magnetominusculus xianensis]KWT91691.1 5-methylthioadenosine/S-adenosylhomocysteine deaminase [Candidatus Magnetominusculus xianensis]MBF0404553.1 amidohydrolase [Nitrospirota bacterium]